VIFNSEIADEWTPPVRRRAPRRPPHRLCRRPDRLADCTTVLTEAASPGPPPCPPPLARRRCAASPSLASAVSRALVPCRRWLAKQRRHRALRGPAELDHARYADRGRGPRTRAAPAPRAWVAPTLCDWAERCFGPVAPG
jgi:hypothetical protein